MHLLDSQLMNLRCFRYGPGGSYHFFAGRDAARAFVTGCFQEDQTPDLRGVEEMFIPVDGDTDPTATPSAEVETGDELKRAGGRTGIKKAELKIRRERELRHARKQVQATIEDWAKLFRGDKNKPYFKVGEIVLEENCANTRRRADQSGRRRGRMMVRLQHPGQMANLSR